MVKRYKLCLLTAMVLGILSGCQEEELVAPALQEPVEVKVDTAVAQRGEIYDIETYGGEIVPYVEEASFLADGLLKELHVMIGDEVEEGQLLATLDDEDILEEIERLEEQLAYTRKMGEFSDQQMQLSIEIAKREYERIRAGYGNYQQLQLKENEIQGLETDLRQAQELRELDMANQNRVIDELKADHDLMGLRAPMAGKIVYIRNVQTGSSIKGYEPLICIADESQLSVKSEYISETQIDNADEIYVQVLDREYQIEYMPYDREEYITMLLSGGDMSTQFLVKNAGPELTSGMFGAVYVKNGTKEDVLLIPANALHSDKNGRYVYLMDGDKRIRRDVTTGSVTDIEVEIKEGLQEGDVVYVKE